MYCLVGEKCKVVMENFTKCLTHHPELIGFIPLCSTDDQLQNSFDHWLHQHVSTIKSQVKSVQVFLTQLTTLKSDGLEFTNFLNSWKLQRIFAENDFDLTWHWVVNELSVELKANNDKEEETDDIDILV